MQRERVYLDKCYWINLRDVVLGRQTDNHYASLLGALRSSVKAKRRLCPISETVFVELLKQEDPHTRAQTAKLIDELSEGVTLAPHPERVATEVAHFFYANTGHSVHLLETLMWSRLSYVLGVQHPVSEGFTDSEQRVFQKAFFDHLWEYPLAAIVEYIGDALPPKFDFESLAKQLNEGNSAHAGSISSFEQAYRAEIHGSLRVATPIALEVIEEMAVEQLGELTVSPAERADSEKDLFNFMCAAATKKEVALALRTLHIGALLHAAVRWDRWRKLTGNDLHDFHHAEAAVAYCDIFLTEQPLRTLLQQKHLHITNDFACRVISCPSEAAQWAMQ